MKNFESVFDNRSFDRDKLIAFGFKEETQAYVYAVPLSDPQFELKLTIFKNGKIISDVIDRETGEVYALVKIPAATGAFVGKLRSDIEKIVAEIADKCFYADVFKSDVSRQVIAYVKNKYGDELEFLWPKFPRNAIFRRADNAKWYAAILTVAKNKLGLIGDEVIEIIDLRADPAQITSIIDGEKYFPGYHMNKKYWLTICLDGSVAAEEIYSRIDNSYLLAQKK